MKKHYIVILIFLMFFLSNQKVSRNNQQHHLNRNSFLQTKEDVLDKVLKKSGLLNGQDNSLKKIDIKEEFVNNLMKGLVQVANSNPEADKVGSDVKIKQKKVIEKPKFEDKKDIQYVFDWIETQGYQDYERFLEWINQKKDEKDFNWFCSEQKSDKLSFYSFNKNFRELNYQPGKLDSAIDVYKKKFKNDYKKDYVEKLQNKFATGDKLEFTNRSFCFSIIRKFFGKEYEKDYKKQGLQKTKNVLEFIFDAWSQLSREGKDKITAESIYNFFRMKGKCADQDKQLKLTTKQINSFILQIYDTHEGYVERREFIYSVMMGLMQRHIDQSGNLKTNEDIEKAIKLRADELLIEIKEKKK